MPRPGDCPGATGRDMIEFVESLGASHVPTFQETREPVRHVDFRTGPGASAMVEGPGGAGDRADHPDRRDPLGPRVRAGPALARDARQPGAGPGEARTRGAAALLVRPDPDRRPRPPRRAGRSRGRRPPGEVGPQPV